MLTFAIESFLTDYINCNYRHYEKIQFFAKYLLGSLRLEHTDYYGSKYSSTSFQVVVGRV